MKNKHSQFLLQVYLGKYGKLSFAKHVCHRLVVCFFLRGHLTQRWEQGVFTNVEDGHRE